MAIEIVDSFLGINPCWYYNYYFEYVHEVVMNLNNIASINKDICKIFVSETGPANHKLREKI